MTILLSSRMADRRRVGQQVRVPTAEIAGEDEPARLAVLAEVELDDRRAQDVPGVEISQGYTRHNFHGISVRDAPDSLDHELNVGQVEERLGGLNVRVAQVGVPRLLALDPRTVAQHDVGDVARGRGRVDRPGVAPTDQARKTPDVVVMRVRNDHRVQSARVERELAVWAVGIHPLGIKQPAVEQKPLGADLYQMSAARDLAGRAVERDSQPKYLPTIDRAPAAPPRHAVWRGARLPHPTSNRRSACPPAPRSQASGQGTACASTLPAVDDNSIMPGTPDSFKPERVGGVRAGGLPKRILPRGIGSDRAVGSARIGPRGPRYQ
jgi:hypothetical protein